MSITDGETLRLEREIERLALENHDLHKDLAFVERWANHHGAKACHSAESVLSVIQHYPAIHAITKIYKDGVVPDTFDPYAEIEKLKDKLGQVYRQQAEELDIASDAMEWAANERDKLVAERDAAMQDAKRGEYMIKHGGWIRGDDQTYLTVLVPQGANLSCVAFRRDAIDKAIQQESS